MTATFNLKDFQEQLKNTLKNIYQPDVNAAALVNKFNALAAPSADDFNALVGSLKEVNYATSKGHITFSPVINLLVAQQDYLTLQVAAKQLAIALGNIADIATVSSGNIVMKCVGNPSAFSLEAINDSFTTLAGAHAARAACMEFSKSGGDLYLSLTGDVGACKGPYDAADAYYHCLSGI